MVLLGGTAIVAEELPGDERPFIVVADPERGCPGVEGHFVALLGRDGVLLMSGSHFPGGRETPRGDNSAAITSPSGASRRVTVVNSAGRASAVWTAAYPLETTGIQGCVAFDKARFSSEGDLVTYLKWLVEDVYLDLPAADRPPAFRLGGRRVVLTVRQPGFIPMEVAGIEGSTLAFRVNGSDGVHLVRAFVLDERGPRVGLQVAASDQLFWREAEKHSAQFVIVTGNDGFELAGAVLTVVIETGGPTRR